MTTITSIKGVEPQTAAQEIESSLASKGYASDVRLKGKAINVGQIRLKEGHNLQVSQSTKSGERKTKALAWEDWVKVNDTMNEVFDKHKASANIKSLGGKFRIRSGATAYHEQDWEDLKYENVGSIMSPVTRFDYIRKYDEPVKKSKKLKEMS